MSGYDGMETLTHSNTREPMSQSALVPSHLSVIVPGGGKNSPPLLHINLFFVLPSPSYQSNLKLRVDLKESSRNC